MVISDVCLCQDLVDYPGGHSNRDVFRFDLSWFSHFCKSLKIVFLTFYCMCSLFWQPVGIGLKLTITDCLSFYFFIDSFGGMGLLF